MPKWLKKSLVILITTLTFGTVAPPAYLLAENNDGKQTTNFTDNSIIETTIIENIEKDSKEEFLQLATFMAKEQSFEKFGPKIALVIEDEFTEVILPKMEEVIASLAEQFDETEMNYLAISEKPTGGNSEKIFHIYSTETGKDIVRFHVRKDRPPLEGYYFNFHYHTMHDNFQQHHMLGSIYWSKNTPPKWMN
ncbi:YpjP family protein [Bacillus sp. FJAT-45066]|uniref:YpjP family protein n=1 Tax=Bacillus sp. FJAT-45066 TaxID=2011010 RepID=UPI0015965E54|nr:YpjP family protein [Bacillus sp. FJAT-45066]